MTNSQQLVKKRHKNINIDGKKSQHSEKKSHKNANLSGKKSQASVKKTQKLPYVKVMQTQINILL